MSDGDAPARGPRARRRRAADAGARAARASRCSSAPDRHLAGRLAERHLGCNVHLLDDGFQHLQLERDVDLLLVDADDLAPERRAARPAGCASRSTRRAAPTRCSGPARAMPTRRSPRVLGVGDAFRARARAGAAARRPRRRRRAAGRHARRRGRRHRAARPVRRRPARRRVRASPRAITFADHHRFTAADLAGLRAAIARGRRRRRRHDREGLRCACCRSGRSVFRWPGAALSVAIEPADAFAAWLRARIGVAPGARGGRVRHAPRVLSRSSVVRALVWPLPMRVVRRLGTLLGLRVLRSRPARIAASPTRNLAAAFPTRTGAECRAIAREMFAHFGRLLLELLKFSTLSRDADAARASSSRARSACARRYAQGKGVLFFTGHFGFWEMHAIVHALAAASRWRCWRARSTTRCCTRCSSRCARRTGNTVIYRSGASGGAARARRRSGASRC